MDHLAKKYPRAVHQIVIRHTRVGDFLLSGDSVLEIDDPSLEVVTLCDGRHTVEEIAEWAARESGEPVEEAYEGLVQFLDVLSGEGVIVYKDFPDPFNPIYSYDRPLSVIWEITYACNQKCEYCIARAGNPDPDELSFQEIDRVLDELVELGVGLINITGGEPLLKMDTALHIARKASENGIDLELLTNGMLITPEAAQEIYDAGVRHAQVSLDCARPDVHDNQRGVKGAWEKTLKGIQNLRDVGVTVMAAAVITSETLQYFEETRRFLMEKADVVKMGSVMPMGRGEHSTSLLTPEMYLTFLELRNTEENQLKDFIFCREKCSIGTTPVISPCGDVYPCMLTKYKELRLGNVRNTSIQSIYRNSDLLHELFDWNVNRVETCRSCWNRYYCGGGCRGCAFAYHGTIYGNDPYQCAARKKFARELLIRGDPVTRKALKRLIALTKSDSGGDDHG
jgi:radical SAM protein with 4Fe4S-binding SPASM domain